jgi:hypothetical protein
MYVKTKKRRSAFRKKKSKTFKKMNCNPEVTGKTINSDSCYTNTALVKIKEAYNKNNPLNTIKSIKNNEIYRNLQTKLTQCEEESCWLDQLSSEDKQYYNKHTFAPYQPSEWKSNPTEWLSNIDILKVLEQYEYSFKDFKFIGPTAIDFDAFVNGMCVEEKMCKFNLKNEIDKGIYNIGIIFNLDRHDQSGSHWVSLYINVKEGVIFYFDSVANIIPNEIDQFTKLVIKQSKDLGIPMKYDSNYPKQHQYGNTECGMYSLFFIITMLDKSLSLKQKKNIFKKKTITDKFIQTFRHKYFNMK